MISKFLLKYGFGSPGKTAKHLIEIINKELQNEYFTLGEIYKGILINRAFVSQKINPNNLYNLIDFENIIQFLEDDLPSLVFLIHFLESKDFRENVNYNLDNVLDTIYKVCKNKSNLTRLERLDFYHKSKKIISLNFSIKNTSNFHSDILINNWNENFKQDIKVILEIHSILLSKNTPIDLSVSVNFQYSKIFGREYNYQNKTNYKILSTLKTLNLRTSKKITDLNFLKLTPNIEVLQVFYSGDKINNLDNIKFLAYLSHLHLGVTGVREINFLERNINLISLTIISSEIKDFSFFRNLPRLESLSFNPEKLSGTHSLFTLYNLKKLNLQNCSNLSDFSKLESLTKLEELTANYLKVDNIEWVKKLNLKKLNIRKGNLSNDDTAWLYANIKSLILL